MAHLAGPLWLIATERHDRTGGISPLLPHRGPAQRRFLSSVPPPHLREGKIRLTEHKHPLPESQAAPFNAEIKHRCLHATMNNEAITPDRQATAV